MADGAHTPRANPRIVPDAVWERVREDYVSGVPAAEACRRHGVGLTALRSRALRDGWRRADQAWTPPERLDPDDEGRILEEEVCGDLDRIEAGQLAWVASRRMMRAVMRGDAVEALRWRRVRVALDAEEAELDRMAAGEMARWRMLHGTGEADSTDSTDSVFQRPGPGAAGT